MGELEWVDLIKGLGLPIVVLILILRGDLVPGSIYNREVRTNERLSEVLETALPALYKSNDVIEKIIPLLEQEPSGPREAPPRRPRR